MIQKFGAPYEAYRQRVPMFFPRKGEWKKLMSAGQFREERRRAVKQAAL